MYMPVALRRDLEAMEEAKQAGVRVIRRPAPAQPSVPDAGQDRPKCGAMTRAGGRCQAPACAGKRRCRALHRPNLHGGPGGYQEGRSGGKQETGGRTTGEADSRSCGGRIEGELDQNERN